MSADTDINPDQTGDQTGEQTGEQGGNQGGNQGGDQGGNQGGDQGGDQGGEKTAPKYEECPGCKGSMRLVGHTDHFSDGKIPETAQGYKKPRKKTPDTSDVDLEAISGAALATEDLISASAPTRERSDQQKAMDAVAQRAYDKWVEADRPSVWAKMPVVTYFLTDEELPKYRYLIRRAVNIVEPADDSPGARVRFGNEFTLSEKMATKIGKADKAGTTVLAWAAIDKRSTDESDDSESKEEKKERPEKPQRRSRNK